MKNLDISKLIQKTEELIYNGRLVGAEEVIIPIQTIELGDFQKYEISIIAKRKTK